MESILGWLMPNLSKIRVELGDLLKFDLSGPFRTHQDPSGPIITSGPNWTHLRLIHANFEQDPIIIGWVIKVLPVRPLRTLQDPSNPIRTHQDHSGSIRAHLMFIHAKFEQDRIRIGWVIKTWPLRTLQDPSGPIRTHQDPLGPIKTSGPNGTHLRLIHAKFEQDPIRIGLVI